MPFNDLLSVQYNVLPESPQSSTGRETRKLTGDVGISFKKQEERRLAADTGSAWEVF
jgi:hypothetical protein